MFNKQLKRNIKAIDSQIEELLRKINSEPNDTKRSDMTAELEDLIKLRGLMSEDRVRESHSKEIIAGLFGITATVLVLQYEKTEVITSKAYSLATRLFGKV